MSKQHEKVMTDLQRLLATQDFKTEDEMRKFMQGLMGTKIPSFEPQALSAKEQAQDLVFEAYDLPPAQGRKKVTEALALDNESIEAFEWLGDQEDDMDKALLYYQKGIEIGEKRFGGKYLKENKGHFWLMHETRPYMRCLYGLADCLRMTDNVTRATAVFEKMIDLNPNDNQGVRDHLLLGLIEIGDFKKFDKYDKIFKDDFMAFPLYNRVLRLFAASGDNDSANKTLAKAIKANKMIPKKILERKDIKQLAGHHGIGDENEADYVTFYSKPVWQSIPGATSWLKKQAGL